jgi:antitoxin component YwqK of YwqJK toxin-antitoxin module
MRDGLPDGRWTYWTRSGAKAEEATFVGGKKNGPATLWDSRGRARRVTYKDNQFAP